MESKEVINNLIINLEKLDTIERENTMVNLAIFEKTIDELKKEKIRELREFFENQIEYYNQNEDKYEEIINKNVKRQREQIERLVNVYNKLYIKTFKILQKARNAQKKEIYRIVILSEEINKTTRLRASKFKKERIARIQRKINYSVIIDTCKERLKWCTENFEKDINSIFVDQSVQLQVIETNVFKKIKRAISVRLSGKVQCKKVIKNYENITFFKTEELNTIKIMNVSLIIQKLIKQMKLVNKQIEESYVQSIRGTR